MVDDVVVVVDGGSGADNSNTLDGFRISHPPSAYKKSRKRDRIENSQTQASEVHEQNLRQGDYKAETGPPL